LIFKWPNKNPASGELAGFFYREKQGFSHQSAKAYEKAFATKGPKATITRPVAITARGSNQRSKRR
jgi:hypothetical protein